MDFGFALEAFEGFDFVVIVADAQFFGVDETDGFEVGSRVVDFDGDLLVVELRWLFGFHSEREVDENL